jgi:hypothetical protein
MEATMKATTKRKPEQDSSHDEERNARRVEHRIIYLVGQLAVQYGKADYRRGPRGEAWDSPLGALNATLHHLSLNTVNPHESWFAMQVVLADIFTHGPCPDTMADLLQATAAVIVRDCEPEPVVRAERTLHCGLAAPDSLGEGCPFVEPLR